MNFSVTEEETVVRGIGIEPARKMEGGFDEKKLAVGVPEADGKGGKMDGDVEEEEDGKPFVVEVVAVTKVAVEVGDVGGGRAETGRVWRNGERECERLMLPYVVGDEGRNGL